MGKWRVFGSVCLWLACIQVAYSAPCYQAAVALCAKTYKQAKEDLKKRYETQKPRCKTRRTEELERCKKDRKIWTCDPPKQLSAEHQKQCAQRVKQVRQRCRASGPDFAACQSIYKRCQHKCIKGCKVCTMRHIAGCVKQCRLSFRLCRVSSRDRARICRRKVAQEQRVCRRAYFLQGWKDYYQCLSNRLRSLMQCQYKAYDDERQCTYQNQDGLRDGLEEYKDAYRLCVANAKTRCGRK
ncbi:MAG: hypothetical protein AAGJ35_08140 [Myxococcota bacterium]